MAADENVESIAPQQILEQNRVGQSEGFQGNYIGTKAAREGIEMFVSQRVDDVVITRSRSICNVVDVDTRIQEVGKTLAAHLDGNTPEGFLNDVRVSKWSDTHPIKWRFERVSGEIDAIQYWTLQKPELVREISDVTGATGARYSAHTQNKSRSERADVTLSWMRDVLKYTFEIVEYSPSAVTEDEDLTLRDWLDELTKSGATKVLERATGIENPGTDSSWNRSTLRELYQLIDRREPGKVNR